ncbi:unnamed protein product [Moneuplotes crassus]|uniref:Uncharacterized protein n=1 Tax=Euplotes crassus TaxID=5936 RepID=A0AAD1UR99_EUPCR|nr:unnamed protein product [Moneuplotes crassus]
MKSSIQNLLPHIRSIEVRDDQEPSDHNCNQGNSKVVITVDNLIEKLNKPNHPSHKVPKNPTKLASSTLTRAVQSKIPLPSKHCKKPNKKPDNNSTTNNTIEMYIDVESDENNYPIKNNKKRKPKEPSNPHKRLLNPPNPPTKPPQIPKPRKAATKALRPRISTKSRNIPQNSQNALKSLSFPSKSHVSQLNNSSGPQPRLGPCMTQSNCQGLPVEKKDSSRKKWDLEREIKRVEIRGKRRTTIAPKMIKGDLPRKAKKRNKSVSKVQMSKRAEKRQRTLDQTVKIKHKPKSTRPKSSKPNAIKKENLKRIRKKDKEHKKQKELKPIPHKKNKISKKNSNKKNNGTKKIYEKIVEKKVEKKAEQRVEQKVEQKVNQKLEKTMKKPVEKTEKTILKEKNNDLSQSFQPIEILADCNTNVDSIPDFDECNRTDLKTPKVTDVVDEAEDLHFDEIISKDSDVFEVNEIQPLKKDTPFKAAQEFVENFNDRSLFGDRITPHKNQFAPTPYKRNYKIETINEVQNDSPLDVVTPQKKSISPRKSQEDPWFHEPLDLESDKVDNKQIVPEDTNCKQAVLLNQRDPFEHFDEEMTHHNDVSVTSEMMENNFVKQFSMVQKSVKDFTKNVMKKKTRKKRNVKAQSKKNADEETKENVNEDKLKQRFKDNQIHLDSLKELVTGLKLTQNSEKDIELDTFLTDLNKIPKISKNSSSLYLLKDQKRLKVLEESQENSSGQNPEEPSKKVYLYGLLTYTI